MGNPAKGYGQTVIESRNPVGSIVQPQEHNPRIGIIKIDMTGWGNGAHDDVSAVRDGIYPYKVGFMDGNSVYQEFSTETMRSNGLGEMLRALRRDFGAYIDMSTRVEIVTPRDCVGNYDKPGALPYGCTSVTDVCSLNEKAMGVMEYGVTYQGPAGARLESVLDEICHQYVCDERAEARRAVRRGAPFKHSICRYYDKDQRNAERFQEFLDACPKDPDTGYRIFSVPVGVDPCADYME